MDNYLCKVNGGLRKINILKYLNTQNYYAIIELKNNFEKSLIKAQAKTEKHNNLLNNLTHILDIKDELTINDNATTKQLGKLINRNDAAVKRFCEILNELDEISYNYENDYWQK